MKKYLPFVLLFALVAVVAVSTYAGFSHFFGKAKPKVHVTSPLTYEETKAALQIVDEAKAEQKIWGKKFDAYNRVRLAVIKAHKLPADYDFNIDDEFNCPLLGTDPCERTVTMVKIEPPPQQVTVPPVKVDPAPPKEKPKK